MLRWNPAMPDFLFGVNYNDNQREITDVLMADSADMIQYALQAWNRVMTK